MHPHPDKWPNSLDRRLPEPLPGEFEARLRHIDLKLAELARRSTAQLPEGLADRVFEASAALLPKPHVEVQRQPQLRLTWGAAARPKLLSREAWGRFAMAASVLLVASVALWFMHVPYQHAPYAYRSAEPDAWHAAEVMLALRNLPTDSATAIENDIAYLLHTKDLQSFEELAGDLRLLVAELDT